MTAAYKTTPAYLEIELHALDEHGFSLLPLKDKQAYIPFANIPRLPLCRTLDDIASGKANCYGIRLDGLVVVDIDSRDLRLFQRMLDAYGHTPIWTKTPRGYHLWYKAPAHTLTWGRSAPEEGVDIKTGPNQYVVGHGSVRTDGKEYVLQTDALLTEQMPQLKLPSPPELSCAKNIRFADNSSTAANYLGQVSIGSRHTFLKMRAKEMVPSVETADELYANLRSLRDDCEGPSSYPDSQVRRLADYWWKKRCENKIFNPQNRHITIKDPALSLIEGNSDATALYVCLVRKHGHIIGKQFALDHAAMKAAGLTDLGRPRFVKARQKLIDVGLLREAARYKVGVQRKQYQLQTPTSMTYIC